MIDLDRWHGATVGALALTLAGVATGVDGLLALALVALGVVAVGVGAASPPADYRIERAISDDSPDPGVPVTVTLTVHNDSDRLLPDVRVTDAVPEGVAVVGGAAAFAASIPPGESASASYELAPPRGEFEFGDVEVRRRNLPGTVVRSEGVAAEGVSAFTCETLVDGMPLRRETIQFVGPTATDEGGAGIEFYSVRDYRPGDPVNRVDWNRYARTGELSTVEYRRERAVDVVFLVDDRAAGHVESLAGGPDSFDLTLYAASRGVVASIENGNRTGVATLSGEWVEPGGDEHTRSQAESLLRNATAGGVATDGGVTPLLELLPDGGQVVVCSPLVDDRPVEVTDSLAARGYGVSVLSPDLSTGIGGVEVTPGSRVERLERDARVRTIRGYDVPVADWDLSEPVMIELRRLRRRWGR